MANFISLLRGINIGGHHKIKMEALKKLYESLKLRDVQTYIQSGNVVFRADASDPAAIALRIENAIEKKFGFRASVVVRTTADLRKVVTRNPFAGRPEVAPNKLAILFLAGTPPAGARKQIDAMNGGPEELHLSGRELYIYFPNGMGRPKFSWSQVDKILRTPTTGRNLNTVRKLQEMAEQLESSR